MKLPCMKAGLAIVVCSLLAACASGPVFQAPEPAPEGRAQLYIYRPMRLPGGGNVHQVKIDGRTETLRLPNGSWQRVELTPGVHTVAISDFLGLMHCSPVLVTRLEAGQTTYVENVVELRGYAAVGTVGLSNIGCSTIVRSPEQALKDLAGLRSGQ